MAKFQFVRLLTGMIWAIESSLSIGSLKKSPAMASELNLPNQTRLENETIESLPSADRFPLEPEPLQEIVPVHQLSEIQPVRWELEDDLEIPEQPVPDLTENAKRSRRESNA